MLNNFRKYSLYHATVEEWTSIVKLAHQWEFLGVKELAVRELEQLTIPPLQKIVIYHSYALDRHLLQAAYMAFATRDESITIEEGQELGLETSLQLARARELVRSPASGGKRIKDAHSPVNVVGSDLDELIRDIFRLSPPDLDSQDQQRKPTGRGANTNGRAEQQSGTQPNGTTSSDPKSVQGGHRERLTPASLCVKIADICVDCTANGVANGHANGTPDGAKSVQTNGTSKGQNTANTNRNNSK